MSDLNMTISHMDGRALSRLLKALTRAEIKIIKGPTSGLIMISITDPFGTDFHLGEALVTEAIVEYDGVRGYGMVMGDGSERAVAAASADALRKSGSPEMAKINKILAQERKKIVEARKKEEAIVESTRVKFETMVLG
ncbi:MAG TPA: phosphonate C-P lyase system protein PhnG [Methanocella sp.]|nr:phosphonate C-P lyase system protein PhnG [Methanocella sp.]